MGKSVSETLFNLVVMGVSPKQIRKIQETFKIPDKRFWWIKIRALASVPKWEALFNFSKEKKSPVGYAVSLYCAVLGDTNSETSLSQRYA